MMSRIPSPSASATYAATYAVRPWAVHRATRVSSGSRASKPKSSSATARSTSNGSLQCCASGRVWCAHRSVRPLSLDVARRWWVSVACEFAHERGVRGSGRCLGPGQPLQISVWEVVSLVQQGFAADPGQRIREAVTEVEPRSMSAALPEVEVGAPGDTGLLFGDRLYPDPGGRKKSSRRRLSTESRLRSTTTTVSRYVPADIFGSVVRASAWL